MSNFWALEILLSVPIILTWRTRRIQHLYTHQRPPHVCNMTIQDPSNYLCKALHFIKFRLLAIIDFLASLIDYHQKKRFEVAYYWKRFEASTTELMKHELVYQYLNSSLLSGSQSLIFQPFLANMYSQISASWVMPPYQSITEGWPIPYIISPCLVPIMLTHTKSFMKI